LPLEEFDKLIDELEDIEDIKLYDEAKKTIMENVSCLVII